MSVPAGKTARNYTDRQPFTLRDFEYLPQSEERPQEALLHQPLGEGQHNFIRTFRLSAE